MPAHPISFPRLTSMAASLILQAPAKLNLMLHITGRRDDGYHLLETVFQFIDLVDHIEFSANDEGSIERLPGNSPVVAAEDILLTTATLLQSRFAVDKGVRINLFVFHFSPY